MTFEWKLVRSLAAAAGLLLLPACAANGHGGAEPSFDNSDDEHALKWRYGQMPKVDVSSMIDWDAVAREVHRQYRRRSHNEHSPRRDADHKLKSEATVTIKLRFEVGVWDDPIVDHPVHCVNDSVTTIEVVGVAGPIPVRGTDNCI
ncbi:MAG: hypothetical protein HXY21_12190 [Parvularculaceae bacterium]|nr:hypothetical protein [Parvularculaceae bacterium]